ncbi:MAG: hypothetical protein COX70_04035 [Flavobacteriales bacterium CG_4_10_14_0_2_um_filter_32_8]|nr:MAG: hypothetical protein COX70_04035 [Flavobacteriales bacterium CG_4_10_14_0_2_um_filter_32_8]PJB14580.1 MAG: hypothetical protein CO118_07875 [Flavobacteriales bacterium CG_4_9_14_3_um_filter_32_8]
MTKNAATLVDKEEISDFTFPKGEVLNSDLARTERDSQIKKAMKLGNNSKGKVQIFFEDTEGLKKVETTIWGVTDKYILLKKTTIIPIRCIHEIKFN